MWQLIIKAAATTTTSLSRLKHENRGENTTTRGERSREKMGSATVRQLLHNYSRTKATICVQFVIVLHFIDVLATVLHCFWVLFTCVSLKKSIKFCFRLQKSSDTRSKSFFYLLAQLSVGVNSPWAGFTSPREHISQWAQPLRLKWGNYEEPLEWAVSGGIRGKKALCLIIQEVCLSVKMFKTELVT